MKKSLILLGLSLSLGLVACGGQGASHPSTHESVDLDSMEQNAVDSFDLRDTYTNKFGEDKIPGQWTDYGVGDPFVLRYDGNYYLYCSTKNFEAGVRAWKSHDLMSWTPVTGEGLSTGYVTNEQCTVTAYAPEVIYYNGYFYMCESQQGSGHYILRSSKPEGPFHPITGNFGESIDGSFFLDDDDQLYFLRASNAGIRIIKVNDDWSMGASRTLDNTQLGGWTEGPCLIKRDGTYFLTYTGNAVTSEGYRVGYSYAREGVFERSSFTQADTILLNTSAEFKGLGHSSSFLGPNLDSYYITYHNLNSSGGPNRSFNVSRLSFDGTEMMVNNGELRNNFVPETPSFYAENQEGLSEKNGGYFAPEASGSVYTVEYNFSGNGTRLVFAYEDANNYSYIKPEGNSIELISVKNGSESTLASQTYNKTYDLGALHTVRVSSGFNKCVVYFDNMAKIHYGNEFPAGEYGYLPTASTRIYSTTCSNKANGSSEYEEVNQYNCYAANYSKSHFTASGLVEEKIADGQDAELYNGKVGSHDLALGKDGDYAKYKIWVETTGYYGIDFIYDASYGGKKVLVQVDDGVAYRMTLPSHNNPDSPYVRSTIGEIAIPKGGHYISIIAENDTVAFHKFELFLSSQSRPSFQDDLSDYVMEGATYITTWKINNGGHYALSGNRNLMYFGDGTFTDLTFEIDIEIVGETQANTCGILLRGKNPAFGSVDSVTSIQGYYVGFNNAKAFISKCNYNNSITDVVADAHTFQSATSYHLKAVLRGNRLSVSIGDSAVNLDYFDATGFTHGNIGLYTDGASCIYRNLNIHY